MHYAIFQLNKLREGGEMARDRIEEADTYLFLFSFSALTISW